MTDLLLCPFCGEKPVQVSHLKAYEQSTFGRFRCENFDCPISGVTINKRAWNGRAPVNPSSVNDLVLSIIRMTHGEQFDLAFKVAENIGYTLIDSRELRRRRRLEEHEVLVARGEAEPL